MDRADEDDGLPDWWERYQMGSLDYDASHQQLDRDSAWRGLCTISIPIYSIPISMALSTARSWLGAGIGYNRRWCSLQTDGDADNDGLSNADEQRFGTAVDRADSDDGVPDGADAVPYDPDFYFERN